MIAAVLIGMTLLGMYLGYWINILGGVAFYFLASVWFLKRRLKFIDKSQFLKAGTQKWPKSEGIIIGRLYFNIFILRNSYNFHNIKLE